MIFSCSSLCNTGSAVSPCRQITSSLSKSSTSSRIILPVPRIPADHYPDNCPGLITVYGKHPEELLPRQFPTVSPPKTYPKNPFQKALKKVTTGLFDRYTKIFDRYIHNRFTCPPLEIEKNEKLLGNKALTKIHTVFDAFLNPAAPELAHLHKKTLDFCLKERCNRYGELLGIGGSAKTHAIFDTVLGISFAAKRAKKRQDGKTVAFLQKEAETLRRLEPCPYVPKVHLLCPGFNDEEGYVLIETLLPQTLSSFTYPNYQLSLNFIKEKIAPDILRALRHTASKGITHCDISFNNIATAVDQRTFLFDFGISHRANPPQDFGVQIAWYRFPGVLIGKPFGPEIDIWNFGCLLYHIFTGHRPFPFPIPETDNNESTCKQAMAQIIPVIGMPTKVFLQQSKKPKHAAKCFQIIGDKVECNFMIDQENQERFTKHFNHANKDPNISQKELSLFWDLLMKMLSYDPISAKKALQHPFFGGKDFDSEIDEKQST